LVDSWSGVVSILFILIYLMTGPQMNRGKVKLMNRMNTQMPLFTTNMYGHISIHHPEKYAVWSQRMKAIICSSFILVSNFFVAEKFDPLSLQPVTGLQFSSTM
jgi:hypothetical protein